MKYKLFSSFVVTSHSHQSGSTGNEGLILQKTIVGNCAIPWKFSCTGRTGSFPTPAFTKGIPLRIIKGPGMNCTLLQIQIQECIISEVLKMKLSTNVSRYPSEWGPWSDYNCLNKIRGIIEVLIHMEYRGKSSTFLLRVFFMYYPSVGMFLTLL